MRIGHPHVRFSTTVWHLIVIGDQMCDSYLTIKKPQIGMEWAGKLNEGLRIAA